jgi:hypothetical protein
MLDLTRAIALDRADIDSDYRKGAVIRRLVAGKPRLLVLVAVVAVASGGPAAAQGPLTRKVPARFVYSSTSDNCHVVIGIAWGKVPGAVSYDVSYWDGYWKAIEHAGGSPAQVTAGEAQYKGYHGVPTGDLFVGVTGGWTSPGADGRCKSRGSDATGGGRFSKGATVIATFPANYKPKPPPTTTSTATTTTTPTPGEKPVVAKIVQIAAISNASPPKLEYNRGGKWYTAYESMDVRVGDQLRTDGNTIAAFEFVIGGRVGEWKNSIIEIVDEGNTNLHHGWRPELRQGGAWGIAPKHYDPLEIQTNGGVFGIKG